MDYYYHDIQRLDWGFGNPNVTATLIAMLAVAMLGAGLVWKRTYWLALLGASGLMIAMIHTLSRGGLVAFLAGAIVLFIAIRPKLNRIQLISLCLCAVSLVAYAQYIGGAGRFVQGIAGVTDRSITNRWLIYKSVPKMIVDAPQGWGMGNAPDTYHQWYQPEGRSEIYLNLVNSHFSWLVEWPWWGRILYGLAWTMLALLLWPPKENKVSGIALGVWAAFFVAASFSAMAHRVSMWVFPIVILAATIPHLWLTRRKISKKAMLLSSLVPLTAYAAVFIAAPIFGDPIEIHHDSGITVIGSPDASERIALIGIDKKILGERYGHRIREFIASHPDTSITVCPLSQPLTQHFDRLVFVGDAFKMASSISADQKFLLNPPSPPANLDLSETSSTTVILGEFNPSTAGYAWAAASEKHPQIEVVEIPGAGVYLEYWTDDVK